jgi:hypothetical protein
MLVVWPVASMHCKLETLPGFDFLRCAVAENGAKDCKDDSCQSVEEAAFKAPDSQNVLPARLEIPDPFRILRLIEESSRERLSYSFLDRVPPELLTCWRFSLRAAQSPRAPSIAV